MTRPGWERLWRHSYHLGCRWLLSGFRHGWRGARGGLCRLLVPLDPWRYYELGKVADQEFAGRCLDVSSPKLLPSLLQRERRGDWLAIDFFAAEIERWRWVDPALRLEIHDARALPFDPESFDVCLCISVVEHIAEDGDRQAMAEMWRVLRPGGILYMTTNVSLVPRDLYRTDRLWGEASTEIGGKVFYERHYSPEQITELLVSPPWEVLEQEYARQIDPYVEERFFRWAPLSYFWGGLLRRPCPSNFALSKEPDVLRPERHGVVYLKLRKPTDGPSASAR